MGNILQDMLKRENVRILQRVDSWQDAVKTAIEPLIAGNYVEPRYVDSVLQNTLLYGPYYVLSPDLAVIHARSEQGVLQGQLAVTLLREPIQFSTDGYGVRVLVTLAAEEPKSHNRCLMHLAALFSNKESVDAIVSAQSCDELYNYFIL